MCLGYELRAVRGWSDDLSAADHEDLHESEGAETYVTIFKSHEVFVTDNYEFFCADGTLKIPGRLGPSLPPESNLEREEGEVIEEGDKKTRGQ